MKLVELVEKEKYETGSFILWYEDELNYGLEQVKNYVSGGGIYEFEENGFVHEKHILGEIIITGPSPLENIYNLQDLNPFLEEKPSSETDERKWPIMTKAKKPFLMSDLEDENKKCKSCGLEYDKVCICAIKINQEGSD